ncbi:MAG: hypothetical protein R3A46_18010 [Thermomicrobiales bacterium]
MAPRKGKAASSKRKKQRRKAKVFEVGQRVQVDGYGEGTVIAVEARRGGRYSDVWVKPDDRQVQEIGVSYQHDLVQPA